MPQGRFLFNLTQDIGTPLSRPPSWGSILPSVFLTLLSLGSIHLNFKKSPCGCVVFRGQEPLDPSKLYTKTQISSDLADPRCGRDQITACRVTPSQPAQSPVPVLVTSARAPANVWGCFADYDNGVGSRSLSARHACAQRSCRSMLWGCTSKP